MVAYKVVGNAAWVEISSALETDAPDAIALRRTTASGRWINFHTDTAARTVQVSAHCRCRIPRIVSTLYSVPSSRQSNAGASDGRQRVRGRASAVRLR